MCNRICLASALIILFCSCAFALSDAQKMQLLTRLNAICASYEESVGVAIIDTKSRWEYGFNASKEFPAASVAKVPIMAAAFHFSDSAKLDLNKKVYFKEADKLGGSGVLQWMKAGRYYSLWNLTRLMIVLSDNTATRLAAIAIGLPQINAYIKKTGLSGTVIRDITMLKEAPRTDINVTTPKDMAIMLDKILKGDGFSKQSVKEMLSFMKNQRYRWGIWRGVPSGVAVADKTGNLEGILNDVGIVYSPKGEYVLSVFTNKIAKKSEARCLINNISRVVYESYTGEKVKPAAKAVKKKRIKKAKAKARPAKKR